VRLVKAPLQKVVCGCLIREVECNESGSKQKSLLKLEILIVWFLKIKEIVTKFPSCNTCESALRNIYHYWLKNQNIWIYKLLFFENKAEIFDIFLTNNRKLFVQNIILFDKIYLYGINIIYFSYYFLHL
jgi:hypothetical protein